MKFVLPGAENFSAYLKSIVEGELTVEGPEVIDWSYGVDYTKRWVVKLDGEILGHYLTFGPKSEEEDFSREYHGAIPGYINEGITIFNQGETDLKKKLPENKVILIWSNKKFVYTHIADAWEFGDLITTPWQRQDGHMAIPFP